MPKPTKLNPAATQFVRGFLLGMLYEQGEILTTARIRAELRVSKATAKRDMKKVRKLVPPLPSITAVGKVQRKAFFA